MAVGEVLSLPSVQRGVFQKGRAKVTHCAMEGISQMDADGQAAALTCRQVCKETISWGHMLTLTLAIRRETHPEGSEGGRGGGVPLGGIIHVPSQKDGWTCPLTSGTLLATQLHSAQPSSPWEGSRTEVCTPMERMKRLMQGPSDTQRNKKDREQVHSGQLQKISVSW